MRLSTIINAYDGEINCLISQCKTTGALETLKQLEAEYAGKRELFNRITELSEPEDRPELLRLYRKKMREFWSARDEAFARVTALF